MTDDKYGNVRLTPEEQFDLLLTERAQRLGITKAEALRTLPDTPRYFESARRRAEEQGKNPQEVLDEDVRQLKE